MSDPVVATSVTFHMASDASNQHEWCRDHWYKYKDEILYFSKMDLGHGLVIIAAYHESNPADIFIAPALQHPLLPWNILDDATGEVRENYREKFIQLDPFLTISVVGQAYTKPASRRIWNPWGSTPDISDDHYCVHGPTGETIYISIPYVDLKIDYAGKSYTHTLRVNRFPDFGVVNFTRSTRTHLAIENDFFGLPHTGWMEIIPSWGKGNSHDSALQKALKAAVAVGGPEAIWDFYLSQNQPAQMDDTGIKSVESRKTIKPNLDRLRTEEPLLWNLYVWLHNGKTHDKVSNNKLLAAFLSSKGEHYESLRDSLRDAMLNFPKMEYSSACTGRTLCMALPGAQDKVTEVRAKNEWAFAKGAKAQAIMLGVDETRHPNLIAAIEAGEIPLGVFHTSQGAKDLINVEFDLIEKALARKGWASVISEIALNASRRTTYTKRFTSYLNFLFKIEKYLNRNAPRKGGWKAMPKFVQSQWELEMDEATEEGTTKRRSALTPVADNDEGTITVPYVAMSVSGVRTTWCYSDIYFVVEEGSEDPVANGVFEDELAVKLNGRDDYGLMFYTLTGTERNQGYPAFLVIFERTTKHGTRVHFHRVHPSRKKDGFFVPPTRLIEECYRYMAGNVRAEDITYQQGDLLFLNAEGPGKNVDDPNGVPVFGFENHSFVPNEVDGVRKPVRLVRSTAKSRDNRLGWIYCETGMRLPHPEHEPIENIPSGWYEVRRCKSYENNPSSVWVLNID